MRAVRAIRAFGTGRRWLPHFPFAVVLAAGIALRVVVELAYRPAFFITDSADYLRSALRLTPSVHRPSGYSVLLRAIPGWRSVWPISLTQHALVVVLAVAAYVVLVRRRVPPWGAALAVAPMLLDPMVLDLEHSVLSDTAFAVLITVACGLLVVRRRLGWRLALLVGVLVGTAVTVRLVGALVIVPVAVAILLGFAKWRPVAAVVAGAAVCIGGYAVWHHHTYGGYALAASSANQVYGRVAVVVDCRHLDVPAYERPLCPRARVGLRHSSFFFTWRPKSPWLTFDVPPGKDRMAVLADFNRRVILQQPTRYFRAVGRDIIVGFEPTRHRATPNGLGPLPWTFQRHFHGAYVLWRMPSFEVHPRVDAGQAGFLTEYNRRFYVPGTALAACALAATLAALGVGRARRSGLRSAAGVLAVTTLVLVGTAAVTAEFSWRYQLPQLFLLPPAGALGLTAMLRRIDDPQALDGRATVRALLGRTVTR